MPVNSHPEVPEKTFDNQDVTKVRQWRVFLQSVSPATIYNREEAVEQAEWSDGLDEHNLISESVTLNTVSFYFEGTRREAHLKAQRKCDKLNKTDLLDDSSWVYEFDCIMLAE
jgi:hypothetical protein